MRNFSVVCRACRIRLPYVGPILACPNCGKKWIDAVYEYNSHGKGRNGSGSSKWPDCLARRGASMWRYRELLPLRNDKNIITLGEGWTPLIRAQNLGLMLGHSHIFIKDERQNPTGSFKDRQASVVTSAMKEGAVKEAVVASTGNVAIAYSAYCTRAGIKLWAFVTISVPAEKMREVALYGSDVIKVAGTYDQAKQVAAEFASGKGLYVAKGIQGIYAKEAMKTIAFEFAEQLGNVAAGHAPSIPHGNRRARARVCRVSRTNKAIRRHHRYRVRQ